MNKTRKEEIPLVNIERNPAVLLISLIMTAGLIYMTFQTLFNKEVGDINPLGFFLFVPTIVISFQTLWFLLNPFGVMFEDKLEIKKSIFHNKSWYYIDICKVGELKNGTFNISYNDDEVERMSLFGIKASHRTLLRNELSKQIEASLKKRD